MLHRFIGYVRAHHVALLALFLAMGGTSYAAITLPSGSVGTRQLRSQAVTLAKISFGAQHALQGAQGPQGPQGQQGPQGSQGPQGLQGPAGLNGTARAYGFVDVNGTLSRAKNIVSVTNPTPGNYCLTLAPGIDPATAVPIVAADFNNDDTNVGADESQAIVEAGDANSPHLNCPNGTIRVATLRHGVDTGSIGGTSVVTDTQNTLTNEPFFIAIP
jgi:Collagen triple helix repeat (20 copies)